MKSIPGYFGHIDDKTYLDRYPPSIIELNRIKDGVLVEFGAGLGNDLLWLIEQGATAERLFYLELDEEAYKIAQEKLGNQFGIYTYHLLLRDAKNSNLKSGNANFVYANNMLHCLEDKDGITAVTSEAYRLLVAGGVFFGRTLSAEINITRLEAIKDPQDNNQRFALQTARALQEGILVGLPARELEDMAKCVGFSDVYTEPRVHEWKPTTDFYFKFVK